jgi:hypothetical protein
MIDPDFGPLQYMAVWNRHPGAKDSFYDLRRRGKGLSEGQRNVHSRKYTEYTRNDPIASIILAQSKQFNSRK